MMNKTTKLIICINERIDAESFEGEIISLIANGVQNEIGSKIEFESISIMDDDGTKQDVKISGALARIRDNVVQEIFLTHLQYKKEELEQMVLLLMRKIISSMPPLKISEEINLLILLGKDTPAIKNVKFKTTVCK